MCFIPCPSLSWSRSLICFSHQVFRASIAVRDSLRLLSTHCWVDGEWGDGRRENEQMNRFLKTVFIIILNLAHGLFYIEQRRTLDKKARYKFMSANTVMAYLGDRKIQLSRDVQARERLLHPYLGPVTYQL